MSKLSKYEFFTQGPWQDYEDQLAIEEAYDEAVKSGRRRIALEWSWCGGCVIKHAVDGRGRAWGSNGNGGRQQFKI